MKTGAELIADERARQIAVEGWDSFHDDEHEDGDLADAAACYARSASLSLFLHQGSKPFKEMLTPPATWPWEDAWWKPKDALSDLVRAGALIAAEIDRHQRQLPTE